jgi:Fur family peroxide stress response transcriptional regulator
MQQLSYPEFRDLCQKFKLAATHQRHIIYQVIMSKPGHYSPEQVYESVKKKVPAISLATVYNNLKTFIESDMLHELSPHHGALRVDANLDPHHHVVCTKCKAVMDVDESIIEPVRLRHKLPTGFRARRFSVDILGLCSRCAS